MIDFLIVGYGNTLRADDGVGPLVVESLVAGNMPPQAHIKSLCLPQLDLCLAALMPQIDVAIFIDARQDEDANPMKVDRVVPLALNSASSPLAHTTHALTLPMLLGLAENWYGRVPCCYLVQPKGFDFSFGDIVSDLCRSGADLARQAIYQIVWGHCDE